LLHIQTHIVDLGSDKDNIITTRLLVPSSEISCFEGRDGSLSDIQKQTSANVQILPREDLPSCALESDELIQVCLKILEVIIVAIEFFYKYMVIQTHKLFGNLFLWIGTWVGFRFVIS
jgi:hypothetical protein